MQSNTSKIGMSILILFLSVSLFVSHVSITRATEDTWESKTPMQVERSRLGVAVVNGKIYAIGGDDVYLSGNCITAYGYYGPIRDANEEYNPATDTWTSKASMPTPRCSFGVAVYQNKIYCIGGRTSDGVTGVNEVYDPATNTWATKTPMPTPRMELQANVVNGKIYMIGGNIEYTTTLNTTEVYDPETDTWTTKTSAPYRLTCGASAVADNKIYSLATESGLDLGALTQIYTPETDSWSLGAKAPTYGGSPTTACATSGMSGPQQILFFSESSTHVYFPSNNSWAVGEPMPTSRGWPGVAVIDNACYVVGGIKSPFDGYIVMTGSVATNERYTLSEYTPVSAVDTKIYIRADGSIKPSTANITTTDNIVYTFTGNNYDRLIIERDNIIVDGNDYTLQGTQNYGITLFQRHNVTIKHLTVTQFSVAEIAVESSANNTITGNTIIATLNYGIHFRSSSNNTITGNSIMNSEASCGIRFIEGSNNNLISSNNITDNSYGILFDEVSGNIISGNNIQFNIAYDIHLYASSNNTITGNNLGKNAFLQSLYLSANSNYNLIVGNNITNSEIGIVIENAADNQVYQNNFVDNEDAHAQDNSINIWDNGEEGNYWSNYNGTDTDENGIGDTPYIINENNQDNHPLMTPVDIATIPELSTTIALTTVMAATLLILLLYKKSKTKN